MKGLGLNKTVTSSPTIEFAHELGDHGNICKYIPLNEIIIDKNGTNITQKNSVVFDRQKAIFKSIDEQGLKLPITVLKEDNIYNFLSSKSGGARMTYAVLRGFTHIIGYVAKNHEEVKTRMIKQAKKEIEYIDEKHISKWWLSTEWL